MHIRVNRCTSYEINREKYSSEVMSWRMLSITIMADFNLPWRVLCWSDKTCCNRVNWGFDYIVEAGNRWVLNEQPPNLSKIPHYTEMFHVWGWCQIGEEQTNKLSSREKNYSKTHSMLKMKKIKLQFFSH